MFFYFWSFCSLNSVLLESLDATMPESLSRPFSQILMDIFDNQSWLKGYNEENKEKNKGKKYI